MEFRTIFLLSLFVHFFSIHPLLLLARYDINRREAIGINIGGGGSPSPSPSPSSSPSCSSCETRLDIAKRTILAFKQQITNDPKSLTNNWTPDGDVCSFKGFKCAYNPFTSQPGVYSAQFNGYYLEAGDVGINDLIGGLPDISIFHANSNKFTGCIPANISNLPYLYELDLSNNKYQGGFPEEVLGGTNLTFLDLRFNSFNGPVHPQVFKLDLVGLFLNNNQFEGQLPNELGSTPASYLTVANNKFTGPIPKTIGLAGNTLYEVLFRGNQLSGSLPYEIGLLKKARVFDVQKNSLTGPLPRSIACMWDLQILILAQNKFCGQVPKMVCKLPKIQNLTLDDNYFTKIGPACRKLVEKKVLTITNNCVKDMPQQRSKQECDEFYKKHRSCRNAYMQKHIPCNLKAMKKGGGEALAPLTTYGALNP